MTKKKEMYSGVFFIGLSIFYFIGTLYIRNYNAFGNVGINSASIPKVLAFLMFTLGSFQFVFGYLVHKREISHKKEIVLNVKEKSTSILDQSIDAEEALLGEQKEDKKSIALTFLFLIILAIFIEHIGFIIMSTFFLIAQMTLLTPSDSRKKKLPLIILLSVVFSITVYFLFTKGFSLLLPSGFLG